MAIALKHPAVAADARRAARPRHPHRGRTVAVTLVSILLALVVLGLIATAVITHTINRRLADMPEYSGHVDQVHVAWWRGGVTVRRFELWLRGHEKDGPVVTLNEARVSVTPTALFRGKLGLRAVLDGAAIVLLKTGPAEKPAKSEEEKERQKQARLAEVRRWQTALAKAFPLELTRMELVNSRVSFVDRTVDPQPELALDQLHLVLTGLGQRPTAADELPAELQLSGRLTGDGQVLVSAQADPTAEQPTFKARTEVTGLQLPPLANFLRAYAKIEVRAGSFEVFMEANAAHGHYEGYVKPFFRDLKFKPAPDESQGPLKRLATSAASAVTSLLKNDQDKVATKAPFQGNFSDNKVDVWTTIENLLRNAFVESLREGLEGQRPTG